MTVLQQTYLPEEAKGKPFCWHGASAGVECLPTCATVLWKHILKARDAALHAEAQAGLWQTGGDG
jgi:hypothetical protein